MADDATAQDAQPETEVEAAAATEPLKPGRYAVIEDSGGQRIVQEGDQFVIDLHEGGEAAAGGTITFDRVLAVSDPSGASEAKVGRPYVDGASVTAEIVEPLVKGEKLHIYKFKPKTGYRRKTGHRQKYTAVKVTSISA